jgi:cell division protein FtsL
MNTNQYNDNYHDNTYVGIGSQKRSTKSLFGLIISDFLRHQKFSLFLLALIVASSVAVLITTQQVRRQLFEREQLLLEQDVLESEWRNLVIEENVLADPKRIESKAKNQLGMSYVAQKNETVIVIKSK